jgi:hypothetical protein
MRYIVGIASKSRLRIFRSYKSGTYRSIFRFSLQQDTWKSPCIIYHSNQIVKWKNNLLKLWTKDRNSQVLYEKNIIIIFEGGVSTIFLRFSNRGINFKGDQSIFWLESRKTSKGGHLNWDILIYKTFGFSGKLPKNYPLVSFAIFVQLLLSRVLSLVESIRETK